MKKEKLDVARGSGNAFRDLGRKNADVEQFKAILAAEIIKAVDREGLTVRAAQRRTGIAAADFSRIRNADLGRFTVDRLMAIINRLGSHVEVKVRVRAATGLPAITKNNHYVPCMYLKRFGGRPGWIYRYDLLVPNAQCPTWVEKPIDRVASANDLYTSIEHGIETDTHEKWLNSEYETPAEEAIDRALTGRSMTVEHWRHLIRFVAAQDVRTPSRLQDELVRWRAEGPALMQSSLKDSVARFKEAKQVGQVPQVSGPAIEPGFPLRVLIKPSSDKDMAEVRVETVGGRSMWLWGQRHVLKGIAEKLHDHQWTILTAPEGITWPATDDPVIRLNFHDEQKYDFKGGWGSKGTEIFMPLDPRHLLYTRIGQKRPGRGTVLETKVAKMFTKFICEHAFRHIFSPVEDPTIPTLRPRHINLEKYRNEKAEWAKWSEDQANAELDLNRPLPGG
jgi:predicted XRE-type DNA-binding protein